MEQIPSVSAPLLLVPAHCTDSIQEPLNSLEHQVNQVQFSVLSIGQCQATRSWICDALKRLVSTTPTQQLVGVTHKINSSFISHLFKKSISLLQKSTAACCLCFSTTPAEKPNVHLSTHCTSQSGRETRLISFCLN